MSTKTLRSMVKLKRKHWAVTLYDEGVTYGPFKVSRRFRCSEVEACLYAIRENKKPDGYSLNLRYIAKPIDGRRWKPEDETL